MSSGLRAWTATGIATLASTYALDATAAAAGAMLAASGVMRGVGVETAAAFLAASYLAWGAALRPSLAANWDLLQRTGASSCLPSKLAHDVARGRGLGRRGRRLATAGGYVGAELVKEAPYYLGATGAVTLSDAVSAADALVFLGGANLGAAAYEYGLARATRALVGRPVRDRDAGPTPDYASFEADWDAARYLADYYGAVDADERHTIAFLVETARGVRPGASLLVFGAGPTLHHAFPFAGRAGRIDLSDMLPGNLREIERWRAGAPGAHDWRPFARQTLGCAGAPADAAAVARLEARTRARIGRLIVSDLRRPRPIEPPGRYDVVVSAYCADSATDDLATWELYMRRIAGLVRPGGVLVVAALRLCRGYRVGDRVFPSANVDAADLRRVLGPLAADVRVEARHLPEQARHGYAGILLARASLRVEPVDPAARTATKAGIG